jgi:hypothetical protein
MSANSLSNLERALSQGKGKGEGEPSNGKPQICGDIEIRIARDGTWHHMGSPIGRDRLVKLFASVLQRDDAGDFWLVTPAEMCRIQVDDAPFAAVEMAIEGTGINQRLNFRTNLDEIVTVGSANPLYVIADPVTGAPAPYITVREGLEALITRAVFYDLVEIAEPMRMGSPEVVGVWSSGAFFEIGTLEDE